MALTIRTTKAFEKAAAKIFAAADLEAVKVEILGNPLAGTLLPNTGGVRYMRAVAKGHGKGRGARVCYWVDGKGGEVWLLTCYFKGNKQVITFGDQKALRALVREISGR